MPDFETQFLAVATPFFAEFNKHLAVELTDLPGQYHLLEFVMEVFPEGVEEYLAQEPQHFAGLANQVTNTAMAVYVNSMALRIYGHSQLRKSLEGLRTA
jgi:hypothetical protein